MIFLLKADSAIANLYNPFLSKKQKLCFYFEENKNWKATVKLFGVFYKIGLKSNAIAEVYVISVVKLN